MQNMVQLLQAQREEFEQWKEETRKSLQNQVNKAFQ